MNLINGLHHITAIARNAQLNHDFYTEVLGMRMVKKTVNFDDPGTYHLYYGDSEGTPGSILTFFPWPGIRRGRAGVGMIGEISYAVPENSVDFWRNRFEELKVNYHPVIERFEEKLLPFEDSEGLRLNLHFTGNISDAKSRSTKDIHENNAVGGFRGVSLMLKEVHQTAIVLTEILGYKFFKKEGNCYRYVTNVPGAVSVVDLFEIPKETRGLVGAGTYHHVAFRVKNEEELMSMRNVIVQHHLSVTEKIDRNYFYSIYFREPGGVLFEVATDNPGFSVDEPMSELGTHLKLPEQYEHNRKHIESVLPPLHS
ncbi:MAG: ring-cleaving dioxygenase [Ginsengibacter sp.]|jgi:glyoxalase family protein